jgi:hypothetical protein
MVQSYNIFSLNQTFTPSFNMFSTSILEKNKPFGRKSGTSAYGHSCTQWQVGIPPVATKFNTICRVGIGIAAVGRTPSKLASSALESQPLRP